MVLARAARRLWRPRGVGGGASSLPASEPQRAGTSSIPHHAVEPTTDVVDLRDTELDPRLAEEIARALDPSTSQ